MTGERPIFIATRGSALALAQSNMMLAACRVNFPDLSFQLKVIKTTGDKLQTVNLTNPNQELTKGLFTKELEVALLNNEADFAVHSLKDLPTELPEGLHLAAATEREDPRDVLIYRDASISRHRGFQPHARFVDFPSGATIATSSTRRAAQVLALRPDLRTVPIRGNVGTRLQKLVDNPELDGTILAMAGLKRLNFEITSSGKIVGQGVPAGVLAVPISVEEMIPCVGQAALGIESRVNDPDIAKIVHPLNHPETHACVTAERAFLRGMGGGCLSPVAAYAVLHSGVLHLRAISFRNEKMERAEITGSSLDAESLGTEVARQLGGDCFASHK